MWENEGRKVLIRNTIVFLLLAAAAAGLLTAMIAVKKQIDAEDELLQAKNSSQRQELSAARQENLEAVSLAYEKDMQTVADYLPGIVCWGDSLTAGSSGNVSYPSVLQKYIDTYLCDIYDFRSTVENAQDYSRLDWDKYTVSIPVVNMGSGQENSATILGRSGVTPYVVGADFEIPGEVESVHISLTSADGKTVTPLTAGNAGVNPVTIAGVEGTITLESEGQGWGLTSYQFTRTEAGEPVSVAKGTEITTACADEYRDYVHIVWLGTYGDFTNSEKLVSDTRQLLSRQTSNPDRYLVLGPCTVRGDWTNANTTTLDAIDSSMLQAFGNHYINVRKYLMVDGLTDAGITASKEEKLVIQQGRVPTSFRSNASGADLNGTAYKLIGKLVYERMESLGYFDEIRQELGLDKTTQEILKTNPKYFETILNAK